MGGIYIGGRFIAINDIFKAARKAGHQLVKEGGMSSQILSAISRPIMPVDEYVQIMNKIYQQMVAGGI